MKYIIHIFLVLFFVLTTANAAMVNIDAGLPIVLTTDVSGVLPIANGGSNKALTPTLGGLVYTDADSFEVLASGSTGYLKPNGAAAPSWDSFPRSHVYLDSGNGHGSTNTKIRRYSNARVNTGTAITYADSATAGASFTINEDGLYSITICDYQSGAISSFGVSVNSSSLTTAITGISYSAGLRMEVDAAASSASCASRTIPLVANDVVRPHTDGTQNYRGHCAS
jgi:hypothetical protein